MLAVLGTALPQEPEQMAVVNMLPAAVRMVAVLAVVAARAMVAVLLRWTVVAQELELLA